MVLFWIIGATVLISLIAFVGIFTLSLKKDLLNEILLVLVGFSAGGLMGGAFFHLLPETLGNLDVVLAFSMLLGGFSLFFILEKALFWRHCHKEVCDVHTFTYMNLVGDAVHNFIDGLIIAAAFLSGGINISLGMATTIAVALHEIPQEIGDFAVLVYGGFSRSKALFYNFLVALTAIAGALVGFFINSIAQGFMPLLLPFAAGGFLYIASSDLIPELHKEADKKKSVLSFVFFVIGIALMFALTLLE